MHPMLLNIPETVASERLLLRPYQSGDGAWLHATLRANRLHLGDALAGIHAGIGLDLLEPDDAERFVRQLTADWILRRRLVFGVWEKPALRYVGEIWIECHDWAAARHELGYFVVEERLRQGIATAAATLALEFLFTTLGAAKVSLTCESDNIGSYRTAERCGFHREGQLRNEVLRPDGTVVDKLCYGLLRSEWSAAD